MGPGPSLGQSNLGIGLGRDQVPKGLRLQQSLFAIQEGPAGELARFSQTHTQGAQVAQQSPHQEGIAVDLKLDHILAGIAVGSREIQHQGALAKPVPPQGSKRGLPGFGQGHQGGQ